MPSKPRRSRRLSRNPAVLVGVLVALTALAVVGGVAYDKSRATAADDYVPTYTPAPPEPAPVGRNLVAIIGDSYTGGSNLGGMEAANWTRLIADQLESTTPIDLTVSGQGGSGYINPGIKGTVFPGEAAKLVRPEDRLVVVFGSRNDTRQPVEAVRNAANATYSQIKNAAPNAKLLVIGPAWTSENVPPNIVAIRDALRAEAAAAGAIFVDPIAEGWFFGADSRLIGSDGVHPTDEGHRYLADRIQPHIQAALAG